MVSRLVAGISSCSGWMSYVPILSTGHGCLKIIKGLGQVADGQNAINKIKKFAKKNREVPNPETDGYRTAKDLRKNGWKKTGRGFTELFPGVGNITLISYDIICALSRCCSSTSRASKEPEVFEMVSVPIASGEKGGMEETYYDLDGLFKDIERRPRPNNPQLPGQSNKGPYSQSLDEIDDLDVP